MTIPFFRGFERADLWAAALVAQSQIWGSPRDALECLDSIEPGAHTEIPGSATVPAVVCSITQNYVFVGVAGTLGWAQWVLNVLGSAQTSLPQIPGAVSTYFGLAALNIDAELAPIVGTALASRRLVCIGHSLGAAICQILAASLSRFNPLARAVFSLGSPRVGDPVFASAVDPVVLRVETTDDPITAVPPVLWAGTGSRFPVPGPGIPAIYSHAGTAQTIDAHGELHDGGNGVSLAAAVSAFLSWSAPTHTPDVYVQRLASGLSLDPFPSVGYANPAGLIRVNEALNGVAPVSRNLAMAYLTKGIMFFRTTTPGVAEGWGEAIYSNTDIGTMQSLLENTIIPARQRFLSNQVSIVGIRSSKAVQGARLNVLKHFPAPYVGLQLLPIAEAGDCILEVLKGTTNARRQMPLRGIPKSWIEGQALTPAGVAGITIINSYMGTLVGQGLGLAIPDPANTVRTITAMANNPLAGGPIQVTAAAAHNLSSGDVVNIKGLRGMPLIRGLWKVDVVDPLNFILGGSNKYNVDFTVGRGTFQKRSLIHDPAFTWGFVGVAWRKTGRPFDQVRGKRSAQVLHH